MCYYPDTPSFCDNIPGSAPSPCNATEPSLCSYILLYSAKVSRHITFSFFADWHRTSKIKLRKISEYRIDANGILVRENCFREMFENANQRRLCSSKIWRCAVILTTVICLVFVVKIFSYAENIRHYFTRNFCYNEYFSDEYLEQSTCACAEHAVFVALRILECCGWTHVYPSVLKADRRSTRSERIALHHHSICRYSIC